MKVMCAKWMQTGKSAMVMTFNKEPQVTDDGEATFRIYFEQGYAVKIETLKEKMMLRPTKCLLTVRGIFFMALAAVGLTSCDGEAKAHKPPMATAIKLSQKGVVAEFDFEVTEHWIYNFAIRFRWTPEEDQNERSRIRKIIGGYELDQSNNPLEPGILTPIELTIIKKDGNVESIAYKKTMTPILTSWGGDAYAPGSGAFTKNIGHCDLAPGTYRVLLKSLLAAEVYSTIPTYLTIGMDKYKSSFDPKKTDRSKTCTR